jgi:hypothetical protein
MRNALLMDVLKSLNKLLEKPDDSVRNKERIETFQDPNPDNQNQ